MLGKHHPNKAQIEKTIYCNAATFPFTDRKGVENALLSKARKEDGYRAK